MTLDILALMLTAPFIGSFLGVLIDRYPLGEPVVMDRSRCDHCRSPLLFRDMIPFVSYGLLGGRCRHCGTPLRRFYPLIEGGALAVAVSGALLVSGWLLWPTVYLGWSLLTLAVIDARHKILPDPIMLPLIPIGLLIIGIIVPDRLGAHVIGAVLGYAALVSIAGVYRRWRGREGLGLGDAKLMAVAGAWLGIEALPGLLLVAAGSALIVALARVAGGDKLVMNEALAFGPYLAGALWVSWLVGPILPLGL